MIKKTRSSKNDLILVFSSILLLILIGFVIFRFSSNSYNIMATKIIGSAILTVDFSSGEKRAFEGGIVENETFIDILNQASKAGNFSYVLDEKSNIVAINDLNSSNKKSWRLYINDKMTGELPSKIIIKNNDNILIIYE